MGWVSSTLCYVLESRAKFTWNHKLQTFMHFYSELVEKKNLKLSQRKKNYFIRVDEYAFFCIIYRRDRILKTINDDKRIERLDCNYK